MSYVSSDSNRKDLALNIDFSNSNFIKTNAEDINMGGSRFRCLTFANPESG